MKSAIIAKATATEFMSGNANAIVGAMHKTMMAARLSDAKDPLARALAKMAGVSDLADCCSFKSGESADMAESGSEVGMLAIGADGSEACVDVMVKTCGGFGASNQTARFWAADLLSQSEMDTPAASALRAICGSLSAEGKSGPRSTPGHLVAHDFAKTGLPLQMWLANPSALDRIARRAFAVEDSTPKGKKLLVVTMRSALPDGDDLHMVFDRAQLRDHVRAQSASVSQDGRKFVKIGIRDDAIELCRFLRLKRKGGDSGARNSDQLQTTISPREMLRCLADGALAGQLLREEPIGPSVAIEALARGERGAKLAVDAHEPMAKIAVRMARAMEEVDA